MNQKETLDDMVFENRNKEYGSYRLRKRYHIRLAIGFGCALLFVTSLFLIIFLYMSKAGDESVYLYSVNLPYLKTTPGTMLSQEEVDAYMGTPPPRSEEQAMETEPIKSKDPLQGFVVKEDANPDTFKPESVLEENTQGMDDWGLIDDSTAFGGYLTGDGVGNGGKFDRIPEFPGGDATKYVERNLRYPAAAIKQKIHGIVIVSFVISKTGHVVNVKIERGVNPIIDQEALKTIKNMPPWRPGMLHGKPINFLFRMPINFVPLS